MGYKRATTKSYPEEDIQKAIISLKNDEFKSAEAAAAYFSVPPSTLKARMAGSQDLTPTRRPNS
jgi:hypothetical protein